MKYLGLKDERMSKDEYYLNITKAVSMRGSCLRRNYGAVIVKNDTIISTGYTGAPRGCENCNEIGVCTRQEMNIPSGQRYELCRSVHAEMNAIINAAKSDMRGATLYLFGRNYGSDDPLPISECCTLCKRMIINAGIEYVVSYYNGVIQRQNVFQWRNDDYDQFDRT